MTTTDAGTPTPAQPSGVGPANVSDTRIVDLVCELEDRRSRGERVTPEELCRNSPELLERVREQWQQIQVANQALGATRTATPSDRDARESLPSIPGYEIIRRLGIGGMGDVFEARSIALKRIVALKTIRADTFARAQLRDRFQVEAEAVARLQHPNIVQIFESGSHDGLPFFAMEFCTNGSLASQIKDKTLPPRESARLIATLARAMAAAHAANIVHRDLKPENVLLAADGTPKVTDFGIAKLLDEEQHLTMTHAVMGTPSYMSPEQARGEAPRIGPLSDVWALGAILYRLITGQLPFPGKTMHETLRMVCEEPPIAPRQHISAIPRDLEVICLKCLRKEPAGRYASSLALAEDLDRYLEGRTIVARPVGNVERAWKWARRNPLVALLFAGLAASIIGGGIGIYTSLLEARRQEAEAKRQTGIADDRAQEIAAKATALDESLTKQRQTNAQLQDELKRARRLLDNGRFQKAVEAHAKDQVELAHEHLDAIDPENRGFEWGYLKRKLEGSIFTLHGHEGSINSVAVSGDDRLIVTGSKDHTARLWDGRTGAPVLELRGHTDEILSVAITRDGLHVFTASRDGNVRIWDSRTGAGVRQLPHGRKVIAVAISPDGQSLITGCEDSTARIWNWQSGELLRQLTGHRGNVTRVAISADGRRIATGSGETIRLWDMAKGELLHAIPTGAPAVAGLAFAPDGRRLYASGDRKIIVIDPDAGKVSGELVKLDADPTHLAISPDGRMLVSAVWDGWNRVRTVCVWDIASQKALREYREHSHAALCLAFSADGQRIISGGLDKTVRVWNVHSDDWTIRPVRGIADVKIALHPDGRRFAFVDRFGFACMGDLMRPGVSELLPRIDRRVTCLQFSANGRYLAAGNENGRIAVLDVDSRQLLAEIWAVLEITGVQLSDDGTRLAAAGKNDMVRTWDVRSQTPTQFNLQQAGAQRFALSSDGKRLATVANNGNTCISNAVTGDLIREFPRRNESTMCLAFSRDGKWLVTGAGNIVRIFDAETGTLLNEITGHTADIRGIDLTADGQRIVTGSVDQTVRVWDVITGASLLEIPGKSIVEWVALSADGQRLFSRGELDTCRAWDGRPPVGVTRLRGHTDRVNRAVVSADGSLLVTGGVDQTVRLWDARTGAAIRVLEGHQGYVNSLDIRRDGKRVVTGSGDYAIRVWDVDSGNMLFQKKEHTNTVLGVWYSPDGKRIYSECVKKKIVWDAETGEQLADAEWVDLPDPSGRFSNGSHTAVVYERTVRLVSLAAPDAMEAQYRQRITRIQLESHKNAIGRLPRNLFADLFHFDFVQAYDPWKRTDRDFIRRAEILEEILKANPKDPVAMTDLARISHRVARWRLTPVQRKLFANQALERKNALELRIVGSLLLRENNPGEAIQPLQMAIALRASEMAPPVEEVLLALAYHKLNRADEAKRWLAHAERWLAGYQTPCHVASMIGKSASGLLPALAPDLPDEPLDPRFRRYDWQSWHEVSGWLAEARRLIRP